MKKFLMVFLLFPSIILFAQNADFNAAAAAFEEDNAAKALSILAQLETKVGANPKIESLRALCYSANGDNKKAYNSVLRYFMLAGRTNNAPANEDMVALEQSLNKGLENELKQKLRGLEEKRREENENIVKSKNSAMENAFIKAKEVSDMYFDKMVATKELTENEINLVKANSNTEAVQKLDANVLKIANISFSDNFALDGDISPIIDEQYSVVLKKLKNTEAWRNSIKKEKGKKFKTEADYTLFFADLKKDLREFYSVSPLKDERDQLMWKLMGKYSLELDDLDLPIKMRDLTSIFSNDNGTIRWYDTQIKNDRIISMNSVSSFKRKFTDNGEFELNSVEKIKEMLETQYGVVKENVRKNDQEQNGGKYTAYTYTYNISTKSLLYQLTFYFGPVGYSVGDRDVITGSALSSVMETILSTKALRNN